MKVYRLVLLIVFLSVITANSLYSQGQDTSWTYNAFNDYIIEPNIVYSSVGGFECRLDVYARQDPNSPTPTVVCIHGGGWIMGSKEIIISDILPYLEMGFSVVNVEYRLAGVSLAPAAVEDCRLALRWIFKNAKEYGFDTTKIVVTGRSAGGHLALLTGMLDSSLGLDKPKYSSYTKIQPKVAAIINWYGITDVNDLVTGPNSKDYAVYWIGGQCDINFEYTVEYMTKRMSLPYTKRNIRSKSEIESIARAVSPISYIRKGLPPVFSVHGDKDNWVPYAQAVRLHDALTKAGVPNQLMTIKGGGHVGAPFVKPFTGEEMVNIYNTIKEFLNKNNIIE